MYIYKTTSGTYELLGFVRIDYLSSNNVIGGGGGYLWMTCNQRILRISLAGYEQVDSAANEGIGELIEVDGSSSGSMHHPFFDYSGLSCLFGNIILM